MHGDGKLYGAVNAHDVVEGLARENIHIAKSKVEFSKSIKNKGTFEVIIHLTARLRSTLQVTVVPE